MSRNKHFRYNQLLHFSIFLILLFTLIFSINYYNVKAEEKELCILITDLEDKPISEILENQSFLVSVYDPLMSYTETPYLSDVEIHVFDNTYQITVLKEIEIKVPQVDSDTEFTLTAIKQGYEINSTQLTVLNKEIKRLFINHDDYILDSGELFSVVITENEPNGDPVSDVLVYIQSYGESNYTNDFGLAKLAAPKDRSRITIRASKEGYQDDQKQFDINRPPNLLEQILNNKYFFIFIAVIILICVIIFVHFKQRKEIYDRAKEISNKRKMEKYETIDTSDFSDSKKKFQQRSTANDMIRVQSKQDPKIEEIRISRNKKEKEIVPVRTDEEKAEDIAHKKRIQRRDYDWFEGTDDIRYEIDKLTGEVDEEGVDKWYEGIDKLKEKIDEKMKKKNKRQKK